MRRQTAVAGGASAGSGRNIRLDPSALPVRYAATIAGGDGRTEADIFLDRHAAIIRRKSSFGAPVTVRLPVGAYDGVAVRMTPVGDAGAIAVVVELMHSDPALSLPLRVADDPADVISDWRAWGEALNLPLLLVDQEGRVVTADSRQSDAALSPTRPRRRHSFFADRRPRFLARRKQGRQGPPERLGGREIVARD